MELWAYPGIVTAPAQGPTFTADLDLGLRWRHLTRVRIAGIRPAAGSKAADLIAQALPVGAAFIAIGQRLDHKDTLVAHILTPGSDVGLVSRIRGRFPPLPVAQFGLQPGRVWRYPAAVRRVVDADTLELRIDLGVPTRLVAPVRLYGVNAPEHGSPAGDAATEWVRRAALAGSLVTVTSRVLEKYGRPLGDITLDDGTDLGGALLLAGHAKPYDGGQR